MAVPAPGADPFVPVRPCVPAGGLMSKLWTRVLLPFICTLPWMVGLVPVSDGRAIVLLGGVIPMKVSKLVVLLVSVAPCPISHWPAWSVTPAPEAAVVLAVVE